jgi:site-specific recombinase XerD
LEAPAQTGVEVRGWLRHLYARKLADRTLATYRRRVEEFLPWLAARRLSFRDVDFRVLEDWVAHLRDQGLDGSVGISLSSIKSFWLWLRREGVITANPFADLEPIRHERRLPEVLGVTDTSKLIESSDNVRDRALLEVIYATGCRRSEAFGMDVQDLRVNDPSPVVLIRKGKGSKQRIEPLTPPAVEALKAWFPERAKILERKNREDERALWVSRLGNRLSADSIYDAVTRAGELAGVEVYPHKLRHSVATHILDAGADLRAVQEFLGHERLQTAQIYTHVAIARLHETIRRTHPRS